MTCQFYVTAKKVVQGGTEIGGSSLPHAVDVRQCKLGRKPDILFWGGKCAETAHDGPCWFWVDEKGNQPDTEFNRYSLKSTDAS